MARKAKKKAADAAAVGIDHSRYEKAKFTDPKTGRTRTMTSNGDAVARAMAHLVGEDAIDTCARKNGLKDEVADREFPNPGMKRMALGNRLRGMIRRGEVAVIGPHEVKTLSQRVALPEAGDKPARARKVGGKKRAARRVEAVAEAAE